LESKFELLKIEGLNAILSLVNSGHTTPLALQPNLLKTVLNLLTQTPPVEPTVIDQVQIVLNQMTNTALLSKALSNQNAIAIIKPMVPSHPSLIPVLEKLEANQNKIFPELENN